MRIARWLLIAAAAVAAGCDEPDDRPGNADAALDAHIAADAAPGPDRGADALKGCAGFCGLTRRCTDLRYATICAYPHDTQDILLDDPPDCASSGSDDCVDTCAEAWRVSTHTAGCLDARQRVTDCFGELGCWEVFDFFDGLGVCDSESRAAAEACASPADQGQPDGDGGWACALGESDCDGYASGPYFYIDPTRPQLTDLRVDSAACVMSDRTMRIPTLLLAGDRSIHPDWRVSGLVGPVGGHVDEQSLTFEHVPDPGDPDRPGHGVLESLGDGESTAVELTSEDVAFSPMVEGGRRLIVLAVDHSGSLLGRREDGTVDLSAASDARDNRVFLVERLLDALPADDLVALVRFEASPTVWADLSDPVDSRAAVRDALPDLAVEEQGPTNYEAAYAAIESLIDDQPDRAAIVVLVTDGGESPESDLTAIGAPDGPTPGAGAPSIIVHFGRPMADPPLGHDPGLARFACRTGGAYVYLDSAEALVEQPGLANRVTARLGGAWQLTVSVDADLRAASASALTTRLGVALGNRLEVADLTAGDRTPGSDSRLLIVR